MMQTHAGYFMAADERVEIGEKIKKVPLGFFQVIVWAGLLLLQLHI